MGPRLVGRGKQSLKHTGSRSSVSFNGAASCGTRKVRFDHQHFSRKHELQWGRVLWDAERWWNAPRQNQAASFNGAASCGTRKDGDRLVLASTVHQLQWGRVLWDAESSLFQFLLIRAAAASMGPRLVGRGKGLAEILSTCPEASFNGAASCGTRKGSNRGSDCRSK